MNRLRFLKSISSLTAGIAAISLSSCADKTPTPVTEPKPEPNEIKPYTPTTSSKEIPYVTTSEYVKDHNGIDGTYVYIPLTQPFEKYDIITNGFNLGFNFYVVDKPEHIIKRYKDGSYEEYYLHTTQLILNNRIDFCPRKYLLPGTQFYKVQAGTL